MAAAKIMTHIAHSQGNTPRHAVQHDDGFLLSQAYPKSFNFKVENKAISLLAWQLSGSDTVTVHRARVGSIGQDKWQISACGLPMSPDLSVNVAHMPYVRCGAPVVLTADNPHTLIDDVGVFFLVYSGSDNTIVELLPDTISRKCCCKD